MISRNEDAMPENKPIPDAELAELRRLQEAATPGEWGIQQPHGVDCIWTDVIDGNGDEIVSAEVLPTQHILSEPSKEPARREAAQALANVQCIAAMHNAFPAILARLDQLQAQLETASGNARLYADRCAALEAEVERLRVELDFEKAENDFGCGGVRSSLRGMTARAEAAESTAAGLRRALEGFKAAWQAWPPSTDGLAHAVHFGNAMEAVDAALARALLKATGGPE
jgi:hypothetical protein